MLPFQINLLIIKTSSEIFNLTAAPYILNNYYLKFTFFDNYFLYNTICFLGKGKYIVSIIWPEE